MPAKKNTKSSDNIENQQTSSQQTVAQVVVCEGERIWWLFLADQPLPEDAQIGKESTTEGSIQGWYLYPEPRIAGTAGDESSDFSFHKQGDTNKKDEMFFYGIIARDVPISRLENSNHKESWILTKENRAFVDAAYAEFVEKEKVSRAEELKRREEAKRQKQMQRLLSGKPDDVKKGKKGGADKKKSAKNEDNAESDDEKESEQEAFSKHLREQMQGWEIVGKSKSPSSSTTANNEITNQDDAAAVESNTQESPQIKFHALLRIPTSLKEIESMFLFKHNVVVGSKSFFNELVIVGEEKSSATSWTRTVFVPVMSPSLVEFPESSSTKNTISDNNEGEENNNSSQAKKDEHDFIISNHVQGKGKHSLLLALDETGDREKNTKLGFARNAALVDKDYVQSLGKTFSNSNSEDAADATPLDRFSQSLSFATRSGFSSKNQQQQQNIFEFGTVFFAVCSLNVEHSIDEGDDDKSNKLTSFMIKNLDPSIVLSEEASSLLCLVPQFVVELTKSANSALRVVLASYLVDQTTQQRKRKSVTKGNQKVVTQKISTKQQPKKNEKRRRQRDSDDDDDDDDDSDETSSSSEGDNDSSSSSATSSNEESDDDDDDDDSENGNKKSRKVAGRKSVVSLSQKKPLQLNKKEAEKLRKNAAVSVPPPTKAKRNQKPLAQLLEELAPAVSSSQSAIVTNNSKNNNNNNSQKRTAAIVEKELKQKKEDTRLELLSQLLADVGESVKMANNNNNNEEGQKEENETASSSSVVLQQQQSTSNNSQSTAYGNFGMSVVPEYGSW